MPFLSARSAIPRMICRRMTPRGLGQVAMGIPHRDRRAADLQRPRRGPYTQFADAAVNVEHTHQVLTAIDSVVMRLIGAETGHRGYFLTKDCSFLEPYKERGTRRQSTRASSAAGRRQPRTAGKCHRLAELAEARLSEMARVLALHESGDSPARSRAVGRSRPARDGYCARPPGRCARRRLAARPTGGPGVPGAARTLGFAIVSLLGRSPSGSWPSRWIAFRAAPRRVRGADAGSRGRRTRGPGGRRGSAAERNLQSQHPRQLGRLHPGHGARELASLIWQSAMQVHAVEALEKRRVTNARSK